MKSKDTVYKMCFGLDLQEECFGLAQHSITEPFFIELLCFLDRTQEKDIIIVGLNKATVV